VLTIRPTKRLAARLGILVPSAPPEVTNRVADWCAHDFMVGRYRHLFFFNTASIYPVVTYARGVTDESSLIQRLIETLKLNLVGSDVGFQYDPGSRLSWLRCSSLRSQIGRRWAR
jgi:hypothetical protein